MIRINPLDLSFLLLENATRRMHMTAFMMFTKPAAQKATFVPKLVEAYRNSQAVAPFNRKLKWLGQGVAAWETVTPDMSYHVRYIAIPAPGSMEQFYETISFLNTSLLDRGHPLWECYVIDGIQGDRFAVMIRVHHALIDGEGGLQVMRNALSDSSRNKRLGAPWMAPEKKVDKPRRVRPTASQMEKVQALFQRLVKLPNDLIGMGSEVVSLGAQSLNLKPRGASLPFTAPRSLFNQTAKSAARVYANIELPLDEVKALAKATGTSLNDVVMTLIDQALHDYLREHQADTSKPLVALMPMSLRDEAGGSGGNQAAIELIAMGQPEAAISQRLQQINAATQSAKAKGRGMQKPVRQVYSMMLMGSLALIDTLPLFGKAPSANLVISNMKGPAEQLYLGGAPMVAFHGLPILPPGAGLNITFASVNQDICLAVGAAPEAVHDPYRLTTLIQQALSMLQTEVSGPKAKAPRRSSKASA
ncbi:wax ester/triacylglycerol synthase family O-acyltransferase [Pseudomonas sp. N040]|uniref:wax ester/triacylglycerol synthase family O-acyltransferase n=1 Tax=Pseudomonas sp. N040 TaxID=2785325 RepID=UPI0018A2EE2E|nr:wax ester/triacylglycerol synthase family O-acyltransferase [Pseudomonas sp. N040]MBF7729256.1 wax ester/triacylglycerol synthase family O-acyltransferase [Pseudomonas sp. N040]MBW7012896.1 wax ester/triacylglycerol synthase family O-acyltransferase [Pseudomonas sp. N040]